MNTYLHVSSQFQLWNHQLCSYVRCIRGIFSLLFLILFRYFVFFLVFFCTFHVHSFNLKFSKRTPNHTHNPQSNRIECMFCLSFVIILLLLNSTLNCLTRTFYACVCEFPSIFIFSHFHIIPKVIQPHIIRWINRAFRTNTHVLAARIEETTCCMWLNNMRKMIFNRHTCLGVLYLQHISPHWKYHSIPCRRINVEECTDPPNEDLLAHQEFTWKDWDNFLLLFWTHMDGQPVAPFQCLWSWDFFWFFWRHRYIL